MLKTLVHFVMLHGQEDSIDYDADGDGQLSKGVGHHGSQGLLEAYPPGDTGRVTLLLWASDSSSAGGDDDGHPCGKGNSTRKGGAMCQCLGKRQGSGSWSVRKGRWEDREVKRADCAGPRGPR